MRGPQGVWIVLLLVAGCVDTGDPADVPSASPDASGDLPTGAPEPQGSGGFAAATLANPPQWRLGEWWKLRVTDSFADGEPYEVTRVVAGHEGDNYLVGMPREKWVNPLLVLHLPGFGQVAKDDLSFEVHDVPFEPLRFPLVEGESWNTAWEGRPITVTVKSVTGTRAEIQATGAQPMNLTYDASIGEFSKMTLDGYGIVEVLDHGYDYQGVVTVPHSHDLIFIEFRFLGALQGNQPAIPQDTVNVDSTYDRVSFAIIIGTVLPDTDSPQGYYQERATAPDGKVYEMTVDPTDTPGIKLGFYMHEKPGGTWTFDHVAAGPGIVGSEGIAYHVYEIEVPGGRILPSTGEHEHGG